MGAYGTSDHPLVPYGHLGAGLRTQMGLVLPPGTNIAAYVRATASSFDPPEIAQRRVTTLAAALPKCRSGAGDVIVVLPGHTENVSTATALSGLVAGTRIMGFGRGSNMPAFRWTATAAQWAVNVADVEISGLRLRLEGANGITKAINVTGANVAFLANDIQVASGASNKATIALEVGTGADEFLFAGNYMYGTATHNVTDGIKFVAATNGFRIVGNDMQFSATAANGLIHVTAAALRGLVRDNCLYNTHTSSTACFVVDNVASDGLLFWNAAATINNGTAASQGFTFGAAALWKAVQTFSVDEAAKNGVLAPAAVST